jgi:hypothetical protein
LYGEAFYDNTLSNPFNPSNPPQTVNLGENTTDEMMLTYFIYTAYQTGDENIILDSTALVNGIPPVADSRQHLFQIYPNPSQGQFTVQWQSALLGTCRWTLLSLQGQRIQAGQFNANQGAGQQTIGLGAIATGTYVFECRTKEGVFRQLIQKD